MHLQLIAASFVEVLDEAKGAVGTAPPCSPKNGPAYLSRAFDRSLRLLGIRRIMASLYHPETNGKAERCHRTIRYHRTIKEQAKLVMHGAPSVLEKGSPPSRIVAVTAATAP